MGANTVWREMIGIERKGQAANLGIRNTMLGGDNDPRLARLQGDDAALAMKEISHAGWEIFMSCVVV